MNTTNIPYLTDTWNPAHGCSPIGAGCLNCWAARMAKRLAGMGVAGYDKADPFKVVCDESRLAEPLRRKKPARIGVVFMGDLFHEEVPFEFILKVFAVTMASPWHTYLMLTKRPRRAAEFYDWWTDQSTRQRYLTLQVGMAQDAVDDIAIDWGKAQRWYEANCDQSGRGRYDTVVPWPLPNVWLGTSASTQADLTNVEELLRIPAAVRWLSLEPLVEAVDLIPLGESPDLDWVVVGDESGPGRRPSELAWTESIVYQCDAAGVPCYVKQVDVGGRFIDDPADPEWPAWACRQMPEALT